MQLRVVDIDGERTIEIGAGPDAVARTIAAMAEVAIEAANDAAFSQTIVGIMDDLPNGQGFEHRLFSLGRSLLTFCPDPQGVELIRTPRLLLSGMKVGERVCVDCDEMTVLLLASALAWGVPRGALRIVTAGPDDPGQPDQHVYPALRVHGALVAIDPQETGAVGERVPLPRHTEWRL